MTRRISRLQRWRQSNPVSYTTQCFWYNLRRRILYAIEHYGRPTEPQHMYNNRYRAAQALGYRSGLEVKVSDELKAKKVNFGYETIKIKYTKPSKVHSYTPDFELLDNGIIVETKGHWVTADRQKIKLIKEQYPDLEIRIVFSNSKTRISKQSQTTYAKYCETLEIKYADKSIPDSWLKEPPHLKSIATIEAIRKNANR